MFEKQVLCVGVPSMRARPTSDKPGGQRQVRRWCGKGHMQRVVRRRGPAHKRAEEASEVADTNRHYAESVALKQHAVAQRCADAEGGKSRGKEEACGTQIVNGPTEAPLTRCEHSVNEHAVGPRSGHYDEVSCPWTARRFAGKASERNLSGNKSKLLAYRARCIEREAEMAGECIRAAKRKDADCRRWMVNEALDDLVERAVAPTGKNEVGAVSDGVGGLRSSGSGTICCDDLGFDPVREKRAGGVLKRGTV